MSAQETPTNLPASSAPSGRETSAHRDAVIFIPGLLDPDGTATADEIARRIAAMMDFSARKAEAKFFLSDEQDESFSAGRKTRVVTIVREDSHRKTPVLDLYDFDYRHALTDAFKRKNPLSQAWTIGLVVIGGIAKQLGALKTPSKSGMQKLQVFWGSITCGILLSYLIVLLFTVGVTVADATRQLMEKRQEQTVSRPEVAAPATTGDREGNGQVDASAAEPGKVEPAVGAAASTVEPAWLYWLKSGVVVATALGLLRRQSLKEVLASTATALGCASNYLTAGARSSIIVGELSKLLEHIFEKEKDRPYRHLHVVGYSFGSLIALDALFSHESSGERFRKVHTLVTIGCPFDFIRTYWPDYFQRRRAWENVPERWINVYAPADVLGSDFRDDPGTSATRGIQVEGEAGERKPDDNIPFGRPAPLGAFEWINFVGFRLHTSYWEQDAEHGISCFRPIVEKLYAGDSALG